MYVASGNNATAVEYYLETTCAAVDCGSYSYSMSHSYPLSMTHSTVHSYSYSMGCAASCSDEVLATYGDQDALCSLNDISCTDDCGAEWIAAHCACDSGTLFASYSFDFLGSDVYCCGDATCQDAVLDSYIAYGWSSSLAEALLEDACTSVTCTYSYSYSMEASYSFAGDDCDFSSCSTEVLSAFGDMDTFCTLDYSCIDCGVYTEWINAHCACDTGALFASYSYDFMGSEDYCCGDEECQEAVVEFYSDAFNAFNLSSEVTAFLDAQCTDDACLTEPPSMTPSSEPTNAPTPVPTHDPTQAPSSEPSISPTPAPSSLPTSAPSHAPTPVPSPSPSESPTQTPSESPTPLPSPVPTPSPTAVPQPGATIVSPAVHWVSENGVNTSSFTITLTTKPVSKVWVSFTAEYKSLSFDPSFITFDYTNYSDVATVNVYAIDDDIDEGNVYTDSIFTTVDSLDSWYECDEALRFDCNQGALYANFTGIEPMTVKIRDDDTAGVTVSSTAVNATYDNYGDALTDGTYTIVLTSEPVDTVTITLSGLDSYSSTSVTTVTIEPEDWDTPVTVTVSCDAATSDRPVCASGNSYCDALDGRTEVIDHSVSSSDSYYDSITVSSVTVTAEVVYDATDPPRVSIGQFNDLLNAIVVTFNQDSDRAGYSGHFDCTLMLDMTAHQVKTLFGSGALCSFTSMSTLKITFGSDATVEPDDEITLLDNVLQSATTGASLYTMNETFVVDQPSSAVVPSISLSASSASIGVCDDLTLDGSKSSGSGGREMTYTFSVFGVSGTAVANVSEVLTTANSANNDQGKYRVKIPSEVMQEGGTMVFTLTAENFLGNSGSSTVTVKKLSVPAPQVSIQGANPYSVTRSDAFKLKAKAELPVLTCVDTTISNSKISFEWFEDTGAFTGDLSGTSKNPRILSVDADTLDAATTYTFRVVGYLTDTPYLNNSATVDVEVSQQPVVALIAGGSYQQFGRDSSFDLDGSGSYDPDDSAGSFSYTWSCEATSSSADCSGLTLPSDASTLSVADLILTVGEYTFELLVVKGSRNDTASVDVEIVSGAPPVISITALTEDKYNTDELFVSVTSTVTSSLSYTTAWSAEDSDVADLFIYNQAYTDTVSNELTVVLVLSLLTEGETYTLVMTATDSDGESSYQTISVVINEPPSSGNLAVTPKRGYALDTSFTFTATNWVDDDVPFTYIFGTTGVNSDGSLDTTSLSPFGDERDDATYEGVTLSTGSNETNYTVGCFTEVIDSYGAVGSHTASVYVRTAELTVAQLKNISETKATESIESNDADAAKQILTATTDGMSSTTDSTRRRKLLGATSDAEALRASVLSNLWATYAITPITVSDVASLLNVLVGVVDTPSEVTYEVASGSHFFLQTILRATLGADIGISTSSSDYVGDVLTYLFETTWFSDTDTASFMNANNVSNSLSLVSAAQLYGAYDGVGYDLNTGDVDMYSYRTAASTLLDDFSVALSLGGSSDTVTSTYFNGDLSDLITASGESSLVSTDLLDLRINTLSSNIYAAALDGTSGTSAAVNSRLDQSGADLSGNTLLRSSLTAVELSLQDSSDPMEITSLPSGMFEVTLAATVVFNTTYKAFDRTFSCGVGMDGTDIDLNCPITTNTHTCDFATHGAGSTYYFTYTCPYVEPTCLYWDETTMNFEGDDCTLMSGYSSDSVTCDCSRTGIFVLGANVTEPVFVSVSTAGPTAVPTPLPTPFPTHIPTPSPTSVPTPLPTYEPTHAPTQLPTYAPTVLPTGVPTSKPSSEPTFEPTYQPTVSPTHLPTPLPSTWPSSAPSRSFNPTSLPVFPPTPLPTLKPTSPAPTPLPTLAPTTSTTASVSVEITMTASAIPTDTDKANLKSSIETATDITNSVVKNLAVTYTSTRRLSGQNDRHRRLTTYTWTVTCDIEADLTVIGESSASSFASTVTTNLNSGTTLSDLITASVNSVSSVDAVVTAVNNREPSPLPTAMPVVAGNSSSSNKGSFDILIIAVICGGAVLLGVLVYFCADRFKADENEKEVDEEHAMLQAASTASAVELTRVPEFASRVAAKQGGAPKKEKAAFTEL
jgi:hypothetical protein